MYRLIVSLLVYQTLALNEHQYTITFIHDDSIHVQDTQESIETLIRIMAGDLTSVCHTSVATHIIHVSSMHDVSNELDLYSNDENRSNAYIVISDCQTAETIIRHLLIRQKETNIIFLDFLICQPATKLEIFHLEIFRFDVFFLMHIAIILSSLCRTTVKR